MIDQKLFMEFVNAIRTSLQKYFDFSTRSSRSEYTYITNSEIIFDIIFTIPSISLSVRRLHDINRSGWWLLLTFTIIGIIPLIYWIGFKKGDVGDNRFGS